MEMTESQPTCWSWSDPPHHRIASNNRQRQVNFQRVLLFPSPFLPMSFSYISIFSNWTAMVLPWEQPKLSPQTELSLLPHTTTLPTTTGSSKYNLVVSFHVLCIFYKCFIAMLHFFNSSSMVTPWEGPKLSPQTKFGLPPCTTTLLTSIGRGGYIFVVSS